MNVAQDERPHEAVIELKSSNSPGTVASALFVSVLVKVPLAVPSLSTQVVCPLESVPMGLAAIGAPDARSIGRKSETGPAETAVMVVSR